MRAVALATWVVALVTACAGAGCMRPAPQPIAFDHRLHDDNNVPCVTCHPTGASGAGATLPSIELCRRCHEEVLHATPDQERIRRWAEAGRPVAWTAVSTLQPYVYFSHRRHVALGGEPCDTCHAAVRLPGPRPVWAAAPPEGRARMDVCTDCHRRSRNTHAGVDCVDCHR